MFDFDDLEEGFEAEEEKLRQEKEREEQRRRDEKLAVIAERRRADEKLAEKRREAEKLAEKQIADEKAAEKRRAAEAEKRRADEKAAEKRRVAEKLVERLKAIKVDPILQEAQADCRRSGLDGDWCSDAQLLRKCLEKAKGWTCVGVQEMKNEAGRLGAPTVCLGLGIQERNVLLARMWAILVWNNLSKEQLEEELNRRSVPFFRLDKVDDLRKRLIYDTYGSLPGAKIPQPMDVRNPGWHSQPYKPKGKDNPAPASPWTGDPTQPPLEPTGEEKGNSNDKSQGEWSRTPNLNSQHRTQTPAEKVDPTAAWEAQSQLFYTSSSPPPVLPAGQRSLNFVKAFPNFNAELPTEEDEKSWTDTQMRAYFYSNGEVRPDSVAKELKRLQEEREAEKRRKEDSKQSRKKKMEEELWKFQQRKEAESQREYERQERMNEERKKRVRHQAMAKLEKDFSVLDLPPGASFNEVRRSYRSMALLYHPDKQEAKDRDASMFRRIKQAYENISQFKKDYDEYD